MDELEVMELEQKLYTKEGALRQARLEIARKMKAIKAHEADIIRFEKEIADDKAHLANLKANG